MQFDSFYPKQADQYAFYCIPRRLFTDSNLKELTVEAKILYGLMLDFVSLSLKNMWIDKKRRVYIIFTLKEVMGTLNCGDKKAT
ncbi:replication initiator protein A [Velocimicrobium porci]|uniref:replication initiator protein A n=1 Tax=Velocimicrobium porci TaxID=2606634 RepID=UPI00197CA864|nr:replication initiator protein A [Velocimicrobium porci]